MVSSRAMRQDWPDGGSRLNRGRRRSSSGRNRRRSCCVVCLAARGQAQAPTSPLGAGSGRSRALPASLLYSYGRHATSKPPDTARSVRSNAAGGAQVEIRSEWPSPIGMCDGKPHRDHTRLGHRRPALVGQLVRNGVGEYSPSEEATGATPAAGPLEHSSDSVLRSICFRRDACSVQLA